MMSCLVLLTSWSIWSTWAAPPSLMRGSTRHSWLHMAAAATHQQVRHQHFQQQHQHDKLHFWVLREAQQHLAYGWFKPCYYMVHCWPSGSKLSCGLRVALRTACTAACLQAWSTRATTSRSMQQPWVVPWRALVLHCPAHCWLRRALPGRWRMFMQSTGACKFIFKPSLPSISCTCLRLCFCRQLCTAAYVSCVLGSAQGQQLACHVLPGPW